MPGRSGTVYKNCLDERGEDFHVGRESRRWIPSMDCNNVLDDQLQDATSVLDAFRIVKLAGDASGKMHRRVLQETLGQRGHKRDHFNQIRLLVRAWRDRLTKHLQDRLATAFTADEAHISVEVAYCCARQVREFFHQATVYPRATFSRLPSPQGCSPKGESCGDEKRHSQPTSTLTVQTTDP